MTEENIIDIDSQEKIEQLISRIIDGEKIAEYFRFSNEEYHLQLLDSLNIDLEEFQKGYFFYDASRNLHIGDSEFNYTWISTYGLISSGNETRNKELNACYSQFTVVSLLFDHILNICSEENVFYIDGYNFGELRTLTPALFHNILFYFEIFGKAYLSLSNVKYNWNHKLDNLYKQVINTMFDKQHNDTLFNLAIVMEFMKNIEYLKTIPGDFKEEYVKYNSNPGDSTIINFNIQSLHDLYQTIKLSNEFLMEYYYDGNDARLLKTGEFDRLFNLAKTEEEKEIIRIKFGAFMRNKI